MEEIGVPDVEIILNGKKTFLEIGISEDMGIYYNVKRRKYQKLKLLECSQIIIFQKDCKIHPTSKQFLEEVLKINMSNVYEELGR
jgi:hypothetical protein